jgi:Cdc6-like AAA superfamily ATPase
MDMFGLDREKKIAKSGVREIYTPHKPIQASNLFFGRQAEIQRLIEHLNTPGQHALLYGERGVGKSSLANVAAELLLQHLVSGSLVRKRCDADDTFASIVEPILNLVGVNLRVQSTQYQRAEGGNAGLSIPVLKAGIETKTTNTTTESGISLDDVTASWVASRVTSLKALFVIDEVDSIQNPIYKRRLAELVKLLSDEASPLKLMLVGIAETSADLVAGHASVQRCLRETRLGRMNSTELAQIVTSGHKRHGLTFSQDASEKIVSVSSGYAHFTHLLALKSAEDAIAEDRKFIDVHHVEAATRRAVEDAEGTLKRTYDGAVRSSGTEEYKKILLAAALCSAEEIVARELREMYLRLWGEEINQQSLNNYFKRLIAEDESAIIRRIAKGVYRFNDPRMPSYIRIAQAYLTAPSERANMG